MLLLCAVLFSTSSRSQSGIDSFLHKLNRAKFAEGISKKTGKLEEKISNRSLRTLNKLQKQEERIYRSMLGTKDSSQARASINDLQEKYQGLRRKLNTPDKTGLTRRYLPKLDSITTSLKFIQQFRSASKVNEALLKSKSLQISFDQAEVIKNFIRDRKQQLRDQLQRLGLLKNLKKVNKEVYYYAAQIKEYGELINDSKKRERKALELLAKTKVFQDFMRKNSLLASLFRMPGDPTDPAYIASLAGLQTRAQVNGLIQQQIASGGTRGRRVVQQSLQQAQSQLNQLKEKVSKSGGSGSDDEIPDFKPSDQKTKSFYKRLEIGTYIQSQRATSFLPVTSDLGLSLGYKLTNKSIIGVGASYKMGWGRGWNNISFTTQGLGIRSFLDFKLKGNLWISGGYEKNYRPDLSDIMLPQAIPINPWQESGLIGLSKSVPIKSKFFKKTKVQLLWDFLSYEQEPRTQPLIFRIGYDL